jgi:hypothetical protein
MGQLCIHHRTQVIPNTLSNIGSDHFKKPFRTLLDLLENTHHFWYANLNFHGCFSFLYKVVVKTLFKGKAPFFLQVCYFTQDILHDKIALS